MALNLSNTVEKFLKDRPGEKFKAREISEWIFSEFPEDCSEKMKRSTATKNPINNQDSLIQQLVAEIGSQRPRIQKRILILKLLRIDQENITIQRKVI